MIRLFLVRHGNTFEKGQEPVQVGLKTDLPLTAEGKEQAKRFAEYLAKMKIEPKAIYAGTLKRQTESARIVNELVRGDLFLNEPSLSEIDYGLWEGLSSHQISSKWPQEYANWNNEGKWASGIFHSSAEEHLIKIKKWLSHLQKAYPAGSTIVAVTSNGLLRFFLSLQKEKKKVEMKVKTGHYCELCLLQDNLEIVSWNEKP